MFETATKPDLRTSNLRSHQSPLELLELLELLPESQLLELPESNEPPQWELDTSVLDSAEW